MLSFDQFFDKINGEMYRDIPPPVKYSFQDYLDGRANGSAELTPLRDEDMGTASAEDVVNQYGIMHNWKNPLLLTGKELSDKEFKKFTGQTW